MTNDSTILPTKIIAGEILTGKRIALDKFN